MLFSTSHLKTIKSAKDKQGLEGGPDPPFPLPFYENPAYRTFSSLSRIPFFLSKKMH